MNTNKGKGTLTNGQVHAKHISSLRENFNRHVGVSLKTGGTVILQCEHVDKVEAVNQDYLS